MASVISPAAARLAGIGLGLTDPQLQVHIDHVEGLLASRIGQLVGSRITTFYASRSVWLPRPAKTGLAVTDDAVALTVLTHYQLHPAGRIYAINGWVYPVTVTWEPDDLEAVKAAICALLDLRIRPFQSQTIGAYSYTRGGVASVGRAGRDEIMAELVYGRGMG